METGLSQKAKMFKALSDETRLGALELLQDGEKCACVLIEKLMVGQSTLSYHMKILVESKIVNARKRGKWIHYTLNEEGCRDAVFLLQAVTAILPTKICETSERCC